MIFLKHNRIQIDDKTREDASRLFNTKITTYILNLSTVYEVSLRARSGHLQNEFHHIDGTASSSLRPMTFNQTQSHAGLKTLLELHLMARQLTEG